MHHVYILKSKELKIYIGCTSDLKRRFSQHKNKKVRTTRNFTDLKLLYYEAYVKRATAFEREKRLKYFGSAYSGLMKRLK